MNERHYVAISIKHSTSIKNIVLWGHRTKDEEKRCFSGYSDFARNDGKRCELYRLEEFRKNYGNDVYKSDEAVKMTSHLLSTYRKYDTVLVDEQDYINFFGLHETAYQVDSDESAEEPVCESKTITAKNIDSQDESHAPEKETFDKKCWQSVTYKQIELMKHAIGFSDRKVKGTKHRTYTPYRNFFNTGEKDVKDWEKLKKIGLADKWRQQSYYVTDEGRIFLGNVTGVKILEELD